MTGIHSRGVAASATLVLVLASVPASGFAFRSGHGGPGVGNAHETGAHLAPPKKPGGGGGGRPAAGGKRPGGGGGGHSRPRPPARGNANVNVNHNVNVNYNDRGHHGGHYNHHDHWDDWDDHWHPARTAATVAVTAAVVGSIVRSVPPNCSTVAVNGISYSQCGNTWYQPQYSGSSVQYVVVNPPR
ncbi:hypothetical protein [Novosphingobium album (ex Hu et al. 2023)]|uniref:Uncharacterized protein n=1 Tax=Novosphingobium album (ex Hu et al. 2023) TaxID=2930093 RepID=A0ABT0B017_9SPHN|nr:hypothetical protein [Novosphingobium album (ex Hu et al. 2023)]MCJ2178377.1 hypothetical protein [Novosphingobium album (ex Hu et al. 2023)]